MTIPLFQAGGVEEILMQINFFYEVTIYSYRSIFFSYLFLGLVLFGETPKAPAIFKEWNITERLISKKSSNWEIEKNSLNFLVKLLEEEKQTIDKSFNLLKKKIPQVTRRE